MRDGGPDDDDGRRRRQAKNSRGWNQEQDEGLPSCAVLACTRRTVVCVSLYVHVLPFHCATVGVLG